MGPSLKGNVDSLSRYRCLSVSNYIVFYRIELDKVLIVRILNSRMNYLNILEL
ncbi:type II toxin-antitoxin system RelE/ParE family toxin [Fibrobacter sp. UWB2]|uniref:type II toxin-antitoxin system RelE/ParE family toxin n=1 Tax=Fibrobacter sp. UWB2 TaxID=1964358 RepID=UPI00351382C5